jgi:hypothetical protein
MMAYLWSSHTQAKMTSDLRSLHFLHVCYTSCISCLWIEKFNPSGERVANPGCFTSAAWHLGNVIGEHKVTMCLSECLIEHDRVSVNFLFLGRCVSVKVSRNFLGIPTGLS